MEISWWYKYSFITYNLPIKYVLTIVSFYNVADDHILLYLKKCVLKKSWYIYKSFTVNLRGDSLLNFFAEHGKNKTVEYLLSIGIIQWNISINKTIYDIDFSADDTYDDIWGGACFKIIIAHILYENSLRKTWINACVT